MPLQMLIFYLYLLSIKFGDSEAGPAGIGAASILKKKGLNV